MPRLQLTTRVVREAVCPPERPKVDLFDTRQAGFLLEVRRSGGKTFYQRYTDARGRTRQFKIGPAGVLSLSAARRKARSIVAEALIGTDPNQRRADLRSIPTLRELVDDRYLPHVQTCKRSWKTDETVLRVHILPALGKRYLDEVKADAISELVHRMREQGYATGTTNRVVVVLRHIFNLARQWSVPGAKDNPTKGIKLAPEVNRERFLSLEEAQRLISSIEQDENTIARKAIMLLLLTGARRNEVTHAEWKHVDWQKRMLLVPLSKSGKPRAVALSTEAIELLRSITPVPGNPYVFPAPSTQRPSPSLYFPWHRIRVRAGLPDLRLHDLRHSFASFLVNNGVNLYTVQDLLGHRHSRYTQRYAHLTSETRLAAAEVVTDLLRKH